MRNFWIIAAPLLVYFGLGWLARYIYFSIYEITLQTTMQEIYSGEIIAGSILCFAYNLVCEFLGKESLISNILLGVPIVLAFIFALLPMSVGASVLNCILCLGSMIAAGFVAFKK